MGVAAGVAARGVGSGASVSGGVVGTGVSAGERVPSSASHATAPPRTTTATSTTNRRYLKEELYSLIEDRSRFTYGSVTFSGSYWTVFRQARRRGLSGNRYMPYGVLLVGATGFEPMTS